ncbi:tail completion protein gp17 [Marinifilum flexuosum]|uniref:Uncharacterized protein DUF3168 n=1 Tax=Marinifilum flexuosum TaxID=1117708 RepID=A0A419WMS3_9BACT|nr:DUF3168 domain-containing protein [Marinifilum flexuosum]RKD96783.1 uncharacterized protein DUF3168 [Marinifilum flexuosum]
MVYEVLQALITDIELLPIVGAQAQALPFATYQVIDSEPNDDMYETNDFEHRVQINVYAKTYIEVQSLCGSIYDKLQRKSGIIGGVDVASIRLIDERDSNIEDRRVSGKQLDYKIIIR